MYIILYTNLPFTNRIKNVFQSFLFKNIFLSFNVKTQILNYELINLSFLQYLYILYILLKLE